MGFVAGQWFFIGVLLALWVAVRGGKKITGMGVEFSAIVNSALALAALATILYIMGRFACRDVSDKQS